MHFALILDRKKGVVKSSCRGKVLVVEKHKTRVSEEGEWKDQQRPWRIHRPGVLTPVLASSKTNTRHQEEGMCHGRRRSILAHAVVIFYCSYYFVGRETSPNAKA